MNTKNIQKTTDLLDAHRNSVSSWWRTQSATMAILKYVYGLIEVSDRKIAEQKQRITQLENMVASDAMTGLLNRRGLEDFFMREVARTQRNKSIGGLFVLIDLDKFKNINDSFGHLAGDACIKKVGEFLKKSIRRIDAVARLGGDEFVLILTETDIARALKKVQQIRSELNGLVLDWESWSIPVGGSIGVEAFDGNSTLESVYRAADAALYADKESRKSKTTVKA